MKDKKKTMHIIVQEQYQRILVCLANILIIHIIVFEIIYLFGFRLLLLLFFQS